MAFVDRTSPVKVVLSTPWFEVIAKSTDATGAEPPHYALRLADYVCTVTTTCAGDFVFVRQYRPAVDRKTLELPAGHVDPHELPVDAARRELEEETGFTPGRIELLGKLAPDTGRLSNSLWCFLALDAVPIEPAPTGEPGIEVVLCSPSDLREKIRSGEFDHALHLAALHLGMVTGKLPPSANPVAPV